MIRRRDLWPLGATGFILAVTASWWALALWSVPGAPEWLERTRAVCFNITDSGLPDAKGWLLLLGQPPSMFGLLLVGWGKEFRESLGHLTRSSGGRLVVAATVGAALFGFALAGLRVAGARLPDVIVAAGAAGAELPRLDRPWPEAPGLIDQSGEAFTRASLASGRAFVTFAFGHCETVCPAVVHEARSARLTLDRDIAIVVVTLDPWRDTPSRLERVLTDFQLDPARDFVVGGPVEQVEAALDAWGIARQRDARTGDIVHPSLVYLIETDGDLAFASTGARDELVTLAERLGWRIDAP